MKTFLPLVAGTFLLFSSLPSAAQSPWRHLPFQFLPSREPVTLRAPTPGVVWGIRTLTFAAPGSYSRTYTLFTSDDGGQTVQSQQIAAYSSTSGTSVYDMWAVDAAHAWVVIYNPFSGTSKLLRTTTGSTAPAEVVGAAPARLRLVRFFSPSTGIGVADVGTASSWPLFQTTDGGTTWQPLAGTPAATANDQATDCVVLGTNLWITTALGNVLSSATAGQTWRVRPSGLSSLASAAFTDALHGLAYDNADNQLSTPGQLAVTADGGQTWTLAAPMGPMRRAAIRAIPGAAGAYLSVGPAGIPYTTVTNPVGTAISTDNGISWQTVEGLDFHRELAVLSPTVAWAGGWYDAGTSAISKYGASLLGTHAGSQAAHVSRLYPNPTTGPVQVPANAAARHLTVYNALGQLQLELELSPTNTSVDLGGLPVGVYQVVTEEKGSRQFQRLSIVR